MDLLNELEHMATNITTDPDSDSEIDPTEITRWQNLFSYTHSTAIEQIETQQTSLSRTKLSDDLWTILRPEQESQNHSRLSYEHSLQKLNTKPPLSSPQSRARNPSPSALSPNYLVLLSGPLQTPSQIQSLASLPDPPSTCPATSEKTGDPHTFCRISASTQQILHSWASREHPLFSPTFVRISRASKDLSPICRHPTLGIDSTLPQHRFSTLSEAGGLVQQDEYPVTYFFYGTLGNPQSVIHLLALPEGEMPVLRNAWIRGGVLRTWGAGKYKALVDGAEGDVVQGWAYEVADWEREEALCIYETEVYGVVRCEIGVEGKGVRKGLTFKFVGGRQLDEEVG